MRPTHNGGQPMIYVGMDVHHKSTTICIQDKNGRELLLDRCSTTFDGFHEKLSPWLDLHPGAFVGMESCSKTYLVSSIISELGGTPRVFPADEVAKKTRSRKKKTDDRDARDLCSNMRTGAFFREVQLAPEPMRRLRTVLRARQMQVKNQTQAGNAAKALLREFGLSGATGSIKTERAWKKRLSQPMPDFVRQLLEVLFSDYMLAAHHIEKLSKIAQKLGESNRSFDVAQSIPGVGDVTRLALAAHLFDISRFSNSGQVVSYVGLCPSCYDSGDRKRNGRITREGPSLLRSLLVECAQQASRRKNPLNPFYRRYVARHGVKKANVAIAAKICRIVFGLVRRGEYFSADALGVKWDEQRACFMMNKTGDKAA